jgi:L-threonylcarbamoyladenylate synthase
MKSIKIDFKKISKEEINTIIDYLKRGKIIVYPTDTIYGLGCLATDKKAIRRILKMKKRQRNRPMIILVSSMIMINKYCNISEKQRRYLKKIWPGPISAIFKSRGILPSELTSGLDSLAARLPNNNFLIKIIKKINAPIVSTSLNISGSRNLTKVTKIEQIFKKDKPDLVINVGEIKNRPSKLVDLRDINYIRVLRN